MNSVRTMAMSVVMALGSSVPAFAVDTSRTYSSGLLIGIFLAFCALLVVVQLLPSLMLLAGFIKGLARQSDQKEATAEAPKA